MFIRFENNNVEHTIEARRYSVIRKGEFTTVVVWPKNLNENTEEYLIIPGSNDDWQRMYVMNDIGKTMDVLRAPEIPEKVLY